MTTKAFVATSATGAFMRPASIFRNWISRSSDAPFPAESGRYHLYVSLACPWASRCLAAMYMKGLDKPIGLSIVHPVFQRTRPDDPEDTHTGWAFADPKATPSLPGPSGLGSYSSRGSIPDTVNNATFVRDLYEMVSSDKTRYTVPLLWDKKQSKIVSNESADIVRMFNTEFNGLLPSAEAAFNLYPEALRAKIDEINDWVYNDISNGVYKSGFATSQEAYCDAVMKVFEGLERAEAILANQRYLAGDVFSEADLRLFTTLIRFDEVYYVHFKTNKKLIQEYPNLSNYLRDIYQLAPVKKSVDMDHIKLHYYGSHTHINTFGIVPAGPKYDYDAPHDRARFTSAKAPTFECVSRGATTYPCVVGHEIVGEVTIAGADVKGLAVGDRVGVGAQVWACLNKDTDAPCKACAEKCNAMCDRGVYTYASKYEDGVTTYGGYADYIRMSSNYAFKIPDSIPSDVMAPLLCAGATVFKPLKNHAKAGDRVGVIGIGGLGHLAIQFIKAIDATPIAFSRSASKKQEILALGAEEFYNLGDPEDAAKAVASVNVLIITADATNMPYDTYLDLLRPRGTCVMLGLPNDKVQFSPWSLLGKDKKFVGSLIGSIQDIKDMLAVASERNVRTIVQKLPMAQVNGGIQIVRDGKARYRIVLEN